MPARHHRNTHVNDVVPVSGETWVMRSSLRGRIVDAYGEPEQRVAFLTLIDENLELPFKTHDLERRTEN